MSAPIRKAVFPVAGLGTRFLPATKAMPKEMLPVVDKPLIQYAAEEAVAAGIDQLIFVTGRTKKAIEDHFDRSVELESELDARGKQSLLDVVRGILPEHVSCLYIRQPEPRGLGHAVLCARPAIGDEPFALILPDDLIDSDGPGCMAQMVEAYADARCSLVAVQEVPNADSDKYGIVSLAEREGRAPRMSGIVEKPSPADAPSNLGVVGRYVLSAQIFSMLEATARGAGGEIQLTDGIARLLDTADVRAFAFEGRRYDCGSKIGFLQATMALARKHPDIGDAFDALI